MYFLAGKWRLELMIYTYYGSLHDDQGAMGRVSERAS
jgi:hypothetical protein